MEFEAKQLLASGVEGLAEMRRRARFRRWLLLTACVVLLGGAGLWGAGSLDRILSPPGLRGGGETAAPPEVFRKMSFLPQARRVPAPGFFLRALDGQNHSLKQHLGKVVLLNFWATWCPPCVREMPSMERLYEKFRAQGLEIVAISLDQGNPDAVRDFVARFDLTFPVVLDPGHEAKEVYRVRALPTTYLVDRKGNVVAYGMGSREWDGEKAYDLIGHLLAEKG